jgi:hypothetical protein
LAKKLRKKTSAPAVGWAGIGGILLLLVATAAAVIFAYFYFSTPTRPVLDAQTLCPVDGPNGITVVLVDTSDDLPETTRRDALRMLEDIIASLPAYYKLDIRVLDIPGARSRSLFSRCNPGDGGGLSEWTNNPRVERLRWMENFRKPAAEAVKNSIAPAKAASSPLMAAIQDIAIDQFSPAASQKATKSLIVVSDMIEYTKDYGQYRGDLTFERYKQSPAYLKFRTNLHGASVLIRYVTRQAKNGQPVLDDAKHGEFWITWMKDNGASSVNVKRLQGT